MSERLVDLHPWSDMVRLCRTGGEANAVAIRIARAATGRDKIAVCGYHGWHDWYLSANLEKTDQLDGHLLPGLEPKGVPQSLAGTVLPFSYNRIEQLERIVSQNNIAAIKMEVMRNEEPKNGFLERVRDIATKNGIVLIFDECTSGFRETFGGLHLKYNIEPDMAIFGKALGNGYAITATIGRSEIMDAAQSTFVSSTFWTERIGPVAALKTLEVMEREESWKQITETGEEIKKRLHELASRHNLPLMTAGIPALLTYSFKSNSARAYKTLVTQEMLASGFLAGNSTYVCTAHSRQLVDSYFAALDPIFGLIKQCEDGADVMAFLSGPICHDGFKRLN